VQLLALALFVYLVVGAAQDRQSGVRGGLFFRFDPLSAFATMLAARTWLAGLSWAILVVLLTVLVGRVWCGWICPLGTLLGAVRFKRAPRRAARLPRRLRLVKHVLLVVTGVMAACGVLALLVVDPISFLMRTTTVVVLPGLDYLATGLEAAVSHVGFLQGTVSALDAHLRGSLLPAAQPHYSQVVLLGLLFVGVFALNALAERFWCRYLCPLGALLGVVAKVAPLRPMVAASCNACGHCEHVCRLDAIASTSEAAERSLEVMSSECTVCLDCLAACPGGAAMRFGLRFRPSSPLGYDPSRREFLAAAAAGLGSVALLGVGVWNAHPDLRLIRPPGVADEDSFLTHCLRCGQCMRVCPTAGLQPSLGEAGLVGLWTPVLKPRLGYCMYTCNACGRSCPSGAIPDLALSVKQRRVIGTAVIDRNRCLPWARNVPCGVCQEVCPLPSKAVVLTDGVMVSNAQGGTNWMTRPVVKAERCIGCGVCENQCPLSGTAAIRVERPSDLVVAAQVGVTSSRS
jgi:MauM/NapG family ferredoxin protein